MPPNLEENVIDSPLEGNVPLILMPLVQINNYINGNNFIDGPFEPIDDESDISIDEVGLNQVPLEQNLRELLVRVTDNEDLSAVTLVKLRVISREVTLQYLNIHTPALRELILDGSIVSSLRDLGNGLRNLKILKVNRCGLTCIDGVFGFENLEELFAADNEVTSLAQCTFLVNLKKLDVRRNRLKHSTLGYLNLCSNLEEVSLEGNDDLGCYAEYRRTVMNALPRLKVLDGIIVSNSSIDEAESGSRPSSSSEAVSGNGDSFNGFSINFPPRVC